MAHRAGIPQLLPKKAGIALSILLLPAPLLQEHHSRGITTLGGEGPSLLVPSSHRGSKPRASQMSCSESPSAACLCSSCSRPRRFTV